MWNEWIGSFWVLIGAIFVAKPGWLRGWFAWRAGGKVKWLVWGFLVVMFVQLAGLVTQIHTPFLRKAGWVLLLVTIILLWTLQAQGRTKMRAWFQGLPLSIFRVIGTLNILVGFSLIW